MNPPPKPLLNLLLAAGLLLALLALPYTAQAGPAPQEVICPLPFQSFSPALNDLAGSEYIRLGVPTGAYGGLYPHGSNTRPPTHEAAGVQIARQVIPLDADGQPDPHNGQIGMISIGMSNTAMEFITFRTNSLADPQVNPRLNLVNGAQAGQTADLWIEPDAETWEVVAARLAHFGLAAAQVEVAWVKLTRAGSGSFPAKAQELQNDLEAVVHNLKDKFPNLKLVYLSSRTRGYIYPEGLSPEPAAFETGFAVKWLIQAQINGDPDLNYNPDLGPVTAPYLSWGPYLWADGLNPRSDGLTWTQADLIQDCTHPSEQGRQKAAALLMDFFKNDSTTGWFVHQVQAVYLPVLVR